MCINNMLTCWALTVVESQFIKRWLMETLNFCKVFFVSVLVKIERQ